MKLASLNIIWEKEIKKNNKTIQALRNRAIRCRIYTPMPLVNLELMFLFCTKLRIKITNNENTIIAATLIKIKMLFEEAAIKRSFHFCFSAG